MVRTAALAAAYIALAACTHTARPEPRGPALKAAAAARPRPAAAAIQTRDLTVTSDAGGEVGSCALGATLLMPAGAAPRALVVILHGSGPMDRDGTLPGGLKPYKRLAEALTAAGYATLRFDKRAAVAGCAGRLRQATRVEHFLADAAAVARAGAAAVPNAPLVLLGHSEGATFADELAASGRLSPAALVLMAGLGRYPIDATVLRQLRAALGRPGLTAEARAEIERLLSAGEAFFLKLREGEAGPDDFYLGAFTAYWQDIVGLTDRLAATAARVEAPALVLWGTADVQVERDDYEALREAHAGKRGSEAEAFEGLDHLFGASGAGTGTGTGTAGGDATMDAAVVRRIVSWLEARLAPSGGGT